MIQAGVLIAKSGAMAAFGRRNSVEQLYPSDNRRTLLTAAVARSRVDAGDSNQLMASMVRPGYLRPVARAPSPSARSRELACFLVESAADRSSAPVE